MRRNRYSKSLWFAVAFAVAMPQAARSHYLWLAIEPGSRPGESTIRAFFNEEPEPDANYLKYVRDLSPKVDGQPLASILGESSREARWAGKAPTLVDAERNLGVMTKGGSTYRLYYTARAQATPIPPEAKEARDKLRVRLVEGGGRDVVQVHFDGKPVAKARIRAYPKDGEPTELAADEQGLATVAGIADGKTALWANWVDPKPGDVGGKPFAETRYYATLTLMPRPDAPSEGSPTTFATMPAPAVNSFGGAVLGDWLYVYGGHAGQTHQYSVETTAKHFRRLNLKDRSTWEELPMGPDVQGVALVSDGRYLYRLGGMAARNAPGQPHDLHSVADFARFDPESRTWTELAPLPEPRSTHDAVVIGRKVYAVGGWSMKGAKEKPTDLKEAAVFDLDRPSAGWKAFDQPFRRRALSAAGSGGKLYVLGGLNDRFAIERRVDVHDPATGTWALGPDLAGSEEREGFATSAFEVDGRLYVSGLSGTISRLDPRGTTWEAIGAWSLPRNTHRLLPGLGRSLLVVGGNFEGAQTPVIESVDLPPTPVEANPAGD